MKAPLSRSRVICSHAASTPAISSRATWLASQPGISTSGMAAAEAAGHGGAGQHHHACVDRDVGGVGVTPAELDVGGVADLAHEVGGVLPPGQGPQPGGDADAHGRGPPGRRRAGVPSPSMVRTVSSLVRPPLLGSSP